MRELPEASIDLTVTSPPYDDLRSYKGFTFDYKPVAQELYRLTKPGGIVVWVVGDATKNGSESGSSFRQALYFIETGFKLHDTMIYEKNSSAFPAARTSKRYTQIFEYMFVFCKGKIRNDITLLCDKPNKWAGHTNWGNNTQYDKDGNLKQTNNIKPVPDFSLRNNIWKYSVGFNDKTGHPAVFPEELAKDHILSWSNEGDVVLDPFMGSGTTAKMAKLNNRHYIGFDISEEYCEIAQNRIANLK
jgi:site-specific DNA-methyltransferase (adenine-specific)